MTEANYNRLIELYGKEFTEACITKLDLYKGSKGKTYKDDLQSNPELGGPFCERGQPRPYEKK